eukprot:4425593-Amphidinium_carterae.1
MQYCMGGNRATHGRDCSLWNEALNGYKPSEQLLWIFQYQNPDEWMSPLPSMTSQPAPVNLLESNMNSVPASEPVQQKGRPEQSEQQGQQLKGMPSQEQSSTSSWQGKSNWPDRSTYTQEWTASSGWQYGPKIEPTTSQGSFSLAESQSSYGRDSGRDIK